MALLVFSDKCPYCQEVIKFITGEPSLKPILRFWNVTAQGVPHKKVTRVPTLVTDEGKLMVGAEVKAWLESMIPNEVGSFERDNFTFNLDGTENDDMMFSMDKYGESLEPRMSDDLKAKISADPSVAYQKRAAM